MKGSSQVILGATLVMAASLAIVLGLLFVLLAELYCSLLLRRGRRHTQGQHHLPSIPAASSTTGLSTTPLTIPSPSSFNPSVPSPLSSFYAQGVLHAPRSLLFPALPSPDDTAKGHHQYRSSDEALELNVNSVDTSASPNFIGTLPGRIIREDYSSLHVSAMPGAMTSHLVYISNPIYNNDASKNIATDDQSHNTPFGTPDSSPSHIESGTSSGADDEYDEEDQTTAGQMHNKLNTPPLTPMKKLPAQASSIPLREAGSLCTSGTDSNTNKGLLSSSSSGTPCTSPSWS